MVGKKMRNTRPKRRNARHLRFNIPEVPFGATEYKGPLNNPHQDSTMITLIEDDSVSSDAAGKIAGQFGNNPSSTANWTEVSTSWAEYRVLGVRFRYGPIYTSNTTTLAGGSGYYMHVHGNPTVPSTLAGAASTGVARRWNIFRPFTSEWRMADSLEAEWQSTAAPASTTACMYLYMQNSTISTLYGNLLTEYLVQVRTHSL